MRIIPTWVPIWVLCSMGLACLDVLLFALSPSSLTFNTDTRLDLFHSSFAHGAGFGLPIIASCIPLVWFCHQKQQGHRALLDRMSHFDIRNAKCTLETDRVVIERAVMRLFDEALQPPLSMAFGADAEFESEVALLSPEDLDEIRQVTSYPTRDQILEEFNAYVRGPLRDSVISNLGGDDQISLRLCVAGVLPLLFVLPLYACEGHKCSIFAEKLGVTSSEQYVALIAINLSINSLFVAGTYLVSFPLQMRGSALITSTIHESWHGVGVLILGILMEGARWTSVCTMEGIGYVVAAKYSHLWFAAFCGCFIVLGSLFWILFLRPREVQTRTLVQCSCS